MSAKHLLLVVSSLALTICFVFSVNTALAQYVIEPPVVTNPEDVPTPTPTPGSQPSTTTTTRPVSTTLTTRTVTTTRTTTSSSTTAVRTTTTTTTTIPHGPCGPYCPDIMCFSLGGQWGCLRGGGSGCFSPKTKILMADGIERQISELQIGELVLNPLTKKAMPIEKIVLGEEQAPLIELGFTGSTLHVTEGHPILARQSGSIQSYLIKKAKELNLEDEIMGSDGHFHRLTVLKKLPQTKNQVVINIEIAKSSSVPEDHLIQADGIVTGDLWLQEKLSNGNNSEPRE